MYCATLTVLPSPQTITTEWREIFSNPAGPVRGDDACWHCQHSMLSQRKLM